VPAAFIFVFAGNALEDRSIVVKDAALKVIGVVIGRSRNAIAAARKAKTCIV
jgi:hypothetical protein